MPYAAMGSSRSDVCRPRRSVMPSAGIPMVPLRFFGMIGSVTTLIGGVYLFYLVIERLFFGVALADRPALLLSSLLVVVGMQLFALGLLGELIIFTHAGEMKEYTIEKIIN